MTALYILLNPYNLIALYFAVYGRAIWGVGPDYKLDFGLYSLFNVFGYTTLLFAGCWIAIRKWKKLSDWKLYFLSSILSMVLIYTISQVYWKIVGR